VKKKKRREEKRRQLHEIEGKMCKLLPKKTKSAKPLFRHNNKLASKPTPMLYMYFLSPSNSCFDYIFFLSKKLKIIDNLE
jgi:hypothetical protein